jgi:protein involved in polysaccharide export with SLBB domain
MKSVFFTIALIVFLFLGADTVQAQKTFFELDNLSEINADVISDADLLGFRNKTASLNLTMDQSLEMLASKGMPSNQVEKIRERLLEMPAANPAKSSAMQLKERRFEPDPNQNKMAEADKDITIFGSELFLRSSMVFEPNIRIATPSSYIVGPDDELIVSVYGYSEMKYNLTINENGEIYIPNVGPLFVGGSSIEQAENKITAKLASTIYKAIRSGQTKVQVRLGKIRSIQVTVIGEAYKPGTYTVSSLTTLYNLLYLCGGPSNMGTYRQIEVIRGNQLFKKADLYDFLSKGDQKDNIILREGDLIRIPYYQNRVGIYGAVKRTGKYEMIADEDVTQLLQYCGGFTENAYQGSITLTRMAEKEKKVFDIQSVMMDGFRVALGDDYYVSKIQNDLYDKVCVTGSVYRPGNYQVDSNITIFSLLSKAGGVREDAYQERANIFRTERGKKLSILSVSIDSVINHGVNMDLKKGDSVHIYGVDDFKDKSFVTIFGNVRKTGNIQWRSMMTVKELLLEAGGINDFGDSTTIEISRRKKKAESETDGYPETETFLVNISKTGKNGDDILIEPFDIVNVKIIPGVINQRTVMILGEVLTPGKYNLQKSNDKITDILERSGGFKKSADSSSLIIRRKKNSSLTVQEKDLLYQRLLNIDHDSISSNQQLRNELYGEYDLINVDLDAALKNKNKFDNLTLEDGDILTVYKRSNLIKVSGEVYYPAVISLKKNKSAKYYIKQAGGFMTKARKVKTLVIYPNGKVKPVRSFFGIKKYPRINSKAEIFVPQKNKENNNRLGLPELALIVSALGIISNVIINTIK